MVLTCEIASEREVAAPDLHCALAVLHVCDPPAASRIDAHSDSWILLRPGTQRTRPPIKRNLQPVGCAFHLGLKQLMDALVARIVHRRVVPLHQQLLSLGLGQRRRLCNRTLWRRQERRQQRLEMTGHTLDGRRVKEIRTQQTLLVTTLQDRSQLAYMRYRGGVDTLLNALDADRDLFNAELSLAHAVATFQDGRVFAESGDATPDNVNKKVRPHFARMALTRAKARALRDALNIGMCSLEELAKRLRMTCQSFFIIRSTPSEARSHCAHRDSVDCNTIEVRALIPRFARNGFGFHNFIATTGSSCAASRAGK